MKKIICMSLAAGLLINANYLQAQSIFQKVKDKVTDKANQKVDDKTDKATTTIINAPENAAKGNGSSGISNSSTSNGTTNPNNQTDQPKPAEFKIYANYDFVPGDTVLFEDGFVEDMDGEFPTHWELEGGQAVLNNLDGKKALLITDGNAGWVSPLMKKKAYLGNEWTFEFDYYRKHEAYQINVYLQSEGKSDLGKVVINADGVTVDGQTSDGQNGSEFSGAYPAEMGNDNFYNKWHHVAIAYKNGQVKVYVDQARAVSVPNTYIHPARLGLGGIGGHDGPLIFTNTRLAAGGKMNMLGKKFTDSKIVTHGINFDVDKATIKPESMGTLNMIVGVLKDNPDVKFVIGGHTDNSGTAAHNLTLSQQRADAVKAQLLTMGVDASRLTTKGFGDTKPIADNTTYEGKAQNRRVEFVKF